MKKIKILIGSLLIATLMTGCASKKNNNITIVGSTAMQPMIEMAAEEFQHHSKVRITVQGGVITVDVDMDHVPVPVRPGGSGFDAVVKDFEEKEWEIEM